MKPVLALQSMFRCQFQPPQKIKQGKIKYDVIKEHKREKAQSVRLRLKVLEMRIVRAVVPERYVEICIRQISRRALVQGKICHKLGILPFFFFFIKGLQHLHIVWV